MGKRISIINGPNLNMLGRRPREVYGTQSLAQIQADCENWGKVHGCEIVFLQSNYEGQLVEWVQEACSDCAAIVINPAAYTHSSIALFDSLEIFKGPVVEVHLSNIYQRESFRMHSYVSRRANAVISGCGGFGYILALDYLAKIMA